MKCPQCGTEYKCSCFSCKKLFYKNEDVKWEFDGDTNIKCLTCGKSEHEGWWLDQEVNQLCEKHGVKTLTEVIEKCQSQ